MTETRNRSKEGMEQPVRKDDSVAVIPFQRRKSPDPRPGDKPEEAPWEPPPAA